MSTALHITLPDGRSYPIHIGAGGLGNLAALLPSVKRCIIISDDHIAPHWLNAVSESLSLAQAKLLGSVVIPAGEGSKSFLQLQTLMEEILSLKPDRHTVLMALGGGVVGDLTGFAASILLRGVPFVQLPTSLLSQVDSSVGGKTGINTRHGKNLVGSFYQPQAVVIDTNTLTTLPDRELRAGLAEIIKAACIADAAFFGWLERHHGALLSRDAALLAQAITSAVRIKADIVMQDEKESGIRALLNLGHTFGHALEVEYGYDGRLNHGEAVAIGICMAYGWAALNGICPPEDAQRVTALISACGLPVKPTFMPDATRMIAHMQQDKKAQEGRITLILPTAIGNCQIDRNADETSLVDFLRRQG